MRKPFIAGNWKMFNTVSESRHLVFEMVEEMQTIKDVEIVLCPPFTALLSVAALLEGTGIGLGAQNMHWENGGAYTGEVSPLMVAEFCQYIILGHSERRMYFCETDQIVNRKTKAALTHGLTPIVCVGETLAEYESNKTEEVVQAQITNSLSDLPFTNLNSPTGSIIIAYEPVWAIGTGKPATAQGANQVVVEIIRPALEVLYGKEIAQVIRVLYGGSIKADNAAEFFAQRDIDGGLVGGASLMAMEFLQIVKAAVIKS